MICIIYKNIYKIKIYSYCKHVDFLVLLRRLSKAAYANSPASRLKQCTAAFTMLAKHRKSAYGLLVRINFYFQNFLYEINTSIIR